MIRSLVSSLAFLACSLVMLAQEDPLGNLLLVRYKGLAALFVGCLLMSVFSMYLFVRDMILDYGDGEDLDDE